MGHALVMKLKELNELHADVSSIDLKINLITGQTIDGVEQIWTENGVLVVVSEYGKHYVNPTHIVEFNYL
jgi:hypothetical protein